jgi:hypothetical protein
MWHCPHCGAPQAETARCWVCRRSSTTCSTCRHFRRAVSADLGYCAFDARRRPLTGRELRGCWEEGVGVAEPAPPPIVEPHRLRAAQRPWPAPPPATADLVPARGFVPIELLGRLPASVEGPPAAGSEPAPEAPPPFVIPEPDEDWSERTSLFGDGER